MGSCCETSNDTGNLDLQRNKQYIQTIMFIQAHWKGYIVRKQLRREGKVRNPDAPPLKKVRQLSKFPYHKLNQKVKQIIQTEGEFDYDTFYIPNNLKYPVLGPYKFKDRNIYEGQFDNGKKQGRGQ